MYLKMRSTILIYCLAPPVPLCAASFLAASCSNCVSLTSYFEYYKLNE